MDQQNKPTVEQLFIYVLLQYSDGLPVEPEFSPIVNRLVRRGFLNKSVAKPKEITISSYGLKLIDKLGLSISATKVD